nr:unnamed protein product [Callosobruchus analis]
MNIEHSYYILSKNVDKKKTIEVESTASGFIHSARAKYQAKNYIGQCAYPLSSSYARRLKLGIFGANRQRKVLQFSSRKSCENTAHKYRLHRNPSCEVWPVKPRRRPLLTSPSIILDLPDFQELLDFSSPLDWGTTGFIATIYEREVHFWHPEGKAMGATRTNQQVGNCLKWNRQGNLLAFATEYVHGSCVVWNIHSQKVCTISSCSCCIGQITALEWTKSNVVITGKYEIK